MAKALLQVEDLHTHFKTVDGTLKAVNGVSFSLEQHSVLAIVGESGTGKTVTALSILQLVPFPGEIVKGSIQFDGVELMGMKPELLRKIRGKDVALVFQNPISALNPVISIGRQVEEVLLEHTAVSKREARAASRELLTQMGIADARQMLKAYPFQLSGGMAQRVMLSIALALNPRVLIADEPTSNLDVTLQAEILHRLRQLQRENGTAIILISHDLGVVAQMADRVAVMYGGYIVECARTEALYDRPLHPYTWGLFQAIPRLDGGDHSLRPMRGTIPKMIDPPDQCPFLDRCPKATNVCRTHPMPRLEEVEADHWVACYNQIRPD